jgi:hypothetical protein
VSEASKGQQRESREASREGSREVSRERRDETVFFFALLLLVFL